MIQSNLFLNSVETIEGGGGGVIYHGIKTVVTNIYTFHT